MASPAGGSARPSDSQGRGKFLRLLEQLLQAYDERLLEAGCLDEGAAGCRDALASEPRLRARGAHEAAAVAEDARLPPEGSGGAERLGFEVGLHFDFESESEGCAAEAAEAAAASEAAEAAEVRSPVQNWARLVGLLLHGDPEQIRGLRSCWRQTPPSVFASNSGLEEAMCGLVPQATSRDESHPDLVLVAFRASGGKRRLKQLLSQERALWTARRQAQLTRLWMHPDSALAWVWALVGMLFLLVDAIFASMSPFAVEQAPAWLAADFCYWAADVVVNFRTGVVISSSHAPTVSYDCKTTAKRYIRGWFCFDVLLLITQAMFIIFDASADLGFVRYLRVFRYLRLARLMKFNRTIGRLLLRGPASKTLDYALQLSLCLLGMFAWLHTSACAWYWIGNTPEGWVSERVLADEWPTSYLVSLHWAASQLQGGTDLYPAVGALGERVFAIAQLIGSVAVLALLVSRFTTVMSSMSAAFQRRTRLTGTARRFLERHQASSDLGCRVYETLRQVQKLEAMRSMAADEDDLLWRLPGHIRRQLLMQARWPGIKQHLVFRSFLLASSHFICRMLHECMATEWYLPDDFVFRFGSIAKKVYVMNGGDTFYTRISGALLGGNAEFKHSCASLDSAVKEFLNHHKKLRGRVVLRDALVCESALWTPWLHRGDLETETEVTVTSLEVLPFVDLVESFPVMASSMSKHAARFVKVLDQHPEATDMLTSEEILQMEHALRPSAAAESLPLSDMDSLQRFFTATANLRTFNVG